MNNQQTNNQKLALKRDTYKALKRMDREQLSEYITGIYIKGYEAGKKASAPNALRDAIRNTLLSVADIGPTRADAIMKRLDGVLGGGDQKETQQPEAAQESTHAEDFLLAALYDSGADLCQMCTHYDECNAPENYQEDQVIEREKCIAGVLEYAKANDEPRKRTVNKPEATAEAAKNEPAPSAPILDAGQFHGSTPPEDEGQKHQIVRGKVHDTGWAIDGHTLTFEIEKDGDVYYLFGWKDEDDEAVMKTIHQADELYQNKPLEEFAEIWKKKEYEPDGRFFLDSCKVDVVEVMREFDK